MTRARYARLSRTRMLDPERDYVEIYQSMLRWEFPWEMKLGLNLAFNRSFSVPAIAAVHVATGELTERTAKRIDDTGLLMYEIILNGFDHSRARDAVRRINQIHRAHTIGNDEYLYVLGCLVIIPLRFLQRYGWRQPCCHERRASVLFYRDLGHRMGIVGIPESYSDLVTWFDEYDARALSPNDDAAAIERATRTLLRGRIPRPLAPFGDALVAALYDDRLRAAVRVPRPAWPARALLHGILRARATALRWFGRPRTVPLFADGIPNGTYPDGYEISRLGPA